MSSKKKSPDNAEEKKEKVAEETAKENKAEEKAAEEKPEEVVAEVVEEEKPTEADALKEANDKYLRLMAEYDNFRKRSQREREALYSDVKADAVSKFLPVYDNLVRALQQSTEDEAYRKGVEMIMTQFDETLKKLGVVPIESVGQTFDPNLHNAVMHEENPEKGENEVVEEFQKGFKIGDKVIRFAMVKVAN